MIQEINYDSHFNTLKSKCVQIKFIEHKKYFFPLITLKFQKPYKCE